MKHQTKTHQDEVKMSSLQEEKRQVKREAKKSDRDGGNAERSG